TRFSRDWSSDVCSSDLDRGELAVADLPGEVGFEGRVGATGTAAQPLVVELDHVAHRAEHGAHRGVRALHVAQVAGILDDHRVGRSEEHTSELQSRENLV